MRIFIISRGYPSERYVTNGIFEFDQAKALASVGHEVIFLAIDLRSIRRKRKFGRESFEKDKIHIEAINIPCGKIPKNILGKVREQALKRLYPECIKKYGEPDIIHSHFLEVSHTTAKVLKNKKIPLVMTEHLSSLNNKVISDEIIKMGNNTYRYYDRVITVGNNLSESLKRNFSVNTIIIPNVVDTDNFSFEKEKSYEDDTFRVISVGSLIKRKHMDLLISAFCEFNKKHNNTHLDIYGNGSEKEELEKIISENNMNSNIVLHGTKSRTEIAQKMKQVDCFALASDVETFGVVYIEAMAMGLPVIATISGGPENFVDSSNGILIKPNDKKLLVEALENMLKTYKTYNKEKIRDSVLNKFSPKSVAKKLAEVYNELIESKKL